MSYNAVLFDLDGTLLHTIPDLTISLNYAAEAVGLKYRYTDEDTVNCIGSGIYELVNRAFNIGNVELEKRDSFYKIFREYYAEHLYDNTRPFNNVIDTLIHLKKMGYKIGVISNKPHEDALSCIRHYFGDLFSFAVGSKDNIPTKPNPYIFEILSKENNLKKENTLYVGDMDIDVYFGENVGMDVCICKHGYGDKNCRNQAKFLIDDFSQIIDILRS